METKIYSLFLDDYRNPKDVWWVTLPENQNWITARNYLEFIDVIEKNGLPVFVSFDHDLDRDTNGVVKAFPGKYDGVNLGNGFDCAKWLDNLCQITKNKFPECLVHSTSPHGGARIREFIKYIKQEYYYK